MPSPSANPTPITPPRVPLIDERTGLIERSWYMFFLSLFRTAQDATDPQIVPDTNSLIASYDAALMALAQEVQAQPRTETTAPDQIVTVSELNLAPELDIVRQEVQTQPKLELGEVLQGKFTDLSYSQTFTGYGVATFHDNVIIDPTKKLYFNTNTYLVESSAGVFDTYVGGVKVVSSTATGTTLIGHPTLETVTATGATGTGKLVFDTSPTLVTPILGTPTSGNFSTGTFTWPTFNQDTTGKAAKLYASPNAYSFTGINTVSGTSVAVLSGTLPAGSATSTNQWMEVIIDSTSFWIPIWAK